MTYAQPITTQEFSRNFNAIIDEVASGKIVYTITSRGKKNIVLMPAPIERVEKKTKKVKLSDLAAFGMWKDREDMKDPVQYQINLRRKESYRTAY